MKTESLAKIWGWILPFSLAGGAFLLPLEIGGISFYLLRWVVLLGGIFGAWELMRGFGTIAPSAKKFLFILSIWMIAGLVSVMFVLDKGEWAKDIFYLFIGISIFLSLYFVFSKGKSEHFFYGWLAGYICNVLFGFFEMYTGNHIAGAFTEGLSVLSPEHYTQFAPAGFFDNPNHYACYLILSLMVFTHFRKLFSESAYFILLFPLVWQIFYTGSKFAILALIIWMIHLFIGQRREWMLKNKNYLKMIPFIGIFFLVLFISFNFKEVNLTNPSEIARKELQKTDPDKRPSSGNMRKALLQSGAHFIKSTYGIGIGAGQFSVYVLEGKAPYDAGHLSDPHNGIIEIASQYGVIVVLLLFWFYYDLFRNYFRASQRKEWIFAFCYLVIILVLQNINSSFISSPLSWFLLALPVVWFIPSVETKKK